jgi:ABC-type uncharacterized transport system permease subunit
VNSGFSTLKKMSITGVRKKLLNKKLVSSLIAICISFILAIIVLISYGKASSIGRFFELMFYTPFANFSENKTKLISTLSILFFAGLAIATSFKGGMFNIGVSGQMLMGGGMSMLILLSQNKIDENENVTNIFNT